MYERHKICPNLGCKEKCFRVQRREKSSIVEMFHEHVPSHRISIDSEIEVLRALVGHCAGWNGTSILRSRLNNRRGGPSRYPGLISNVAYPEEGVIRRYFSWGDLIAWSDSVISPSSFRREGVSDGGA